MKLLPRWAVLPYAQRSPCFDPTEGNPVHAPRRSASAETKVIEAGHQALQAQKLARESISGGCRGARHYMKQSIKAPQKKG